jgi:hypothetical protein
MNVLTVLTYFMVECTKKCGRWQNIGWYNSVGYCENGFQSSLQNISDLGVNFMKCNNLVCMVKWKQWFCVCVVNSLVIHVGGLS